jgi:hypothetical protein
LNSERTEQNRRGFFEWREQVGIHQSGLDDVLRQYWRDFESLERWTHADPHRTWWKQFLQDTGGTSFWHELYSVRGGFESVYIGVEKPIGFLRFANPLAVKGGLFSSRDRLRRGGTAETLAPYTETQL